MIGDWGLGTGNWGLGIGLNNGEWGIESDLISLKQIKSEYISLVIASCFAISDFLFRHFGHFGKNDLTIN